MLFFIFLLMCLYGDMFCARNDGVVEDAELAYGRAYSPVWFAYNDQSKSLLSYADGEPQEPSSVMPKPLFGSERDQKQERTCGRTLIKRLLKPETPAQGRCMVALWLSAFAWGCVLATMIICAYVFSTPKT